MEDSPKTMEVIERKQRDFQPGVFREIAESSKKKPMLSESC